MLIAGIVATSAVRRAVQLRTGDPASPRLTAQIPIPPRQAVAGMVERTLPPPFGSDLDLPDLCDVPPPASPELAEFNFEGTRTVALSPLPWKAGDSWVVETHYLRLQNADPTWASPVLWRFTVQGREDLAGRTVHVVKVQLVDPSSLSVDPEGTLYIAADDHSVLAIRDRVLEQGVLRERFLKYEEADAGAISTLFPTTLPAPGTEAIERKSSVGICVKDPFQPDPPAEAPKTSGVVIDVEFESNGVTIHQRWDAAEPRWPLYIRTPSTVSYLRRDP